MLWPKFRLLLWKNWLIQRRHPWQTSLEILIPVLFSGMLVLLRSLVDVVDYPDDWLYEPVPINSLDPLRDYTRTEQTIDFRLAYAPAHPTLDAFVRTVAADLQLPGVVSAANSSELERMLLADNYVAGIQFVGGAEIYSDMLPRRLQYALRFPGELRTHHSINPLLYNWQTDKSITPYQEPGPRTRYQADGGIPPGYRREGFLAVQHAIARRFVGAHASVASAVAEFPEVLIRRFPHPGFRNDMLINGLEMILPVIIVIAFIYPCINITKVIALEKERQLKEAMQIMGLPGWLHWAGWWVRAAPPLFINSALMVVVLKVPWSNDSEADNANDGVLGVKAVMMFSDWSVLFAFLVVYNVTTVAFCCMMSVFFGRANVAAAMAGIVWFGLYLVYQFVDLDALQLGGLLALCLLANTGMAFGVLLMLRFEAAGQGCQWANLFETYSVDNDLTVGYVMVMMLATALLYMLIALYVEQIRPGEYGVPRPWYFPVQAKFWCGQTVKKTADNAKSATQQQPGDADNFEPIAGDRRAGVEIRGLHKMFGRSCAVQPMRLDMLCDQITVLLGHNGAGKTTTMSMLTGMITPTAGMAYVNGYDIRYDIDAVRQSLGLCPQHNILFDDLTVREHLEFFARLKGIDDRAAVDREIAKYLRLLALEPKADTRSAALSGGMKRKLAVCVAFCGGSKVVFCDEPSSGMDPAARRALWEFIRQEKRGRTVLLSTHFMDEADVLGDRIAILNAGELKCCGSPYFLKKRFGVGYHLVCTKRADARPEQTAALGGALCSLSPMVTVAHESNTELSYRLPDAMQADFKRLFRDLEENYAAYGLKNFGVSLTTLEDVFMNVGSDANELTVHSSSMSSSGSSASTAIASYSSLNSLNSGSGSILAGDSDFQPPLTGLQLWLSQTIALFCKRFHQTTRSWPLLCVQVLIPAIFVVATILIERNRRQFGNLPPLSIELGMYADTVTLLQNHTGLANDSLAMRFDRAYTDIVQSTEPSWAHQLHAIDDDMSDYLLRLSRYQLVQVNRQYYVGAHLSDNGTVATAWFNNQPYHAVPLAVSLVHSALVRAQLGADYAIHVTNTPLPYTESTLIQLVGLASRMGMTLGLNIAFAMAFCVAFFVLPVVREQANSSKLLQFVSGAKVPIYWGTAFAWDYAVFAGISALLIGVLVAFQEEGWSTATELGRVFLCLMAFGYAALPVTYLCARVFRVPTAAFTILTIAYLLGGVVMPITVTALLQYDNRWIADGLAWAFQLMPHFALNTCLRYMEEIAERRRICGVMCDAQPECTTAELMCRMNSEQCCEFEYFAMEAPGIGTLLVYLVGVGTLAMVLNLVIEFRWLDALWYWVSMLWRRAEVDQSAAEGHDAEDDDVLEERYRVQAMSMYEVQSQSLVVKEMSKRYGKFTAVKRISVAVDGAECFGLLGTNGAGKTSTFKMLTGDLPISDGHAWVRGIPLRTRMNSAHKIIGYCPQFDALVDEMTGRQILSLFCRLRGIRAARIYAVIAGLAAELNFTRHLDKQVRACSGGNRRKLSTAVALIGRPAVVYLDEPTTGMDPGAKRHLWDVVTRQRRAGAAIVLTSHSMDECEALCTRLAIMVNGQFKCLGSVQHLKSKFARGYALMVKVRPKTATDGASEEEQLGRVKAFVLEAFEGAVLQNQFHHLLTYYVPSGEPARKWSSMFGLMNAAKRQLPIDDYALSQTTLEQVFMSFTEQQTTAVAAAGGISDSAVVNAATEASRK